MNDVLTRQNSLMEKILKEYGAMIKGAVYKASAGMPCAEDIISEVNFAVLLTLRKLGDGWTPPRSFIFSIIRNKVNDFLRQKYKDRGGIEEIKKLQAEQASQIEEVSTQMLTLTHCEFKVFRLLGLGLTNQEIAENLHISLHTVRSHVKKVHAKSGIKDRGKLTLSAHHACFREFLERVDEAPATSSYEPSRYRQQGALSGKAS